MGPCTLFGLQPTLPTLPTPLTQPCEHDGAAKGRPRQTCHQHCRAHLAQATSPTGSVQEGQGGMLSGEGRAEALWTHSSSRGDETSRGHQPYLNTIATVHQQIYRDEFGICPCQYKRQTPHMLSSHLSAPPRPVVKTKYVFECFIGSGSGRDIQFKQRQAGSADG